MSALQFQVKEKIMPKILINIGALLDIPTSAIVIGARGESIVNGGLGQVTAIVGGGNNFKSTIMHYMMLAAADRIKETTDTAMTTYDTEINISLDRLDNLASKHANIGKGAVIPNGDKEPIWVITDKTIMPAEDWVGELEKYSAAKKNDKSLKLKLTAFKDPYTKQTLEVVTPTFAEVDSMSELEASSTMDIDADKLDDSSTQMIFMRQGLFKTKFFTKVPTMTTSGNIYLLMTAHVGEKNAMASGASMYAPQPTKTLQHLNTADKIKGVTGKFNFLLNNGWQARDASVLKNQTTKMPEYPLSDTDGVATDLNVVRLVQLRGKHGPSGYIVEIVVSQTEGVLPTLTEFHYIKSNKYGIDGSDRSYFLDIYPDVKLSRTTVRSKINSDSKLRRAINITAELHQLGIFHPYYKEIGLLCTPKELYEDLIKLGYDWNELLETRGYWTPDQYNTKVPFLSCVDLLNMRAGTYHPYWMKKKEK